MTAANDLGEFLRAARGRLEPGDVGLPPGAGGRRVSGLRREEVAVLAGVSADYYARLEQGRERRPSPQVVDAVGRALRLTLDARHHLYRLAGLHPRSAVADGHHRVHPALVELLDSFPRAAAYVLGPAFDILASNQVADALCSPFLPERSMPRILFTHPRAREVFAEWEIVARATVHALQLNAGRFPDDAVIGAVIEELRTASPLFGELWAERTVGGLARAYKVFVHPDVGRLELTYQTFEVTDAPGQQLLVGTPASGSRSAEAVAYLAATAAV